jgi:hypothetical protein
VEVLLCALNSALLLMEVVMEVGVEVEVESDVGVEVNGSS